MRKVELIPTKFLRFRKENGRIRAEVESHEKENGITLNEEDNKVQELLRGFLSKADKERNEELKKLLVHKGQQKPAIITSDGFLINGNRRKLALEALYDEKNQDPNYEMMRVVILPEGATELDIQKIENRYQLQSEGKSAYHGLNRALTIRKNIEKGFTLEAQLRDDPNYHDLPPDDFTKIVEEHKKTFLQPLESVDRYLKLFNRTGIYTSISDSSGDKEGRWQAFVDYSGFYNSVLKNKKVSSELGITRSEIPKIENALFKLIRKRSLSSKIPKVSFGKIHMFLRGSNLKKYLRVVSAKQYLLKIDKDIDKSLPNKLKKDEKGNLLDYRKLDESWGKYNEKKIINHLSLAVAAVSEQEESGRPIKLLETAYKKLTHRRLAVEKMETKTEIRKALKLVRMIEEQLQELKRKLEKQEKSIKKKKH